MKKKLLFSAILFLTVSTGCSDLPKKRPEGILSRQQMVEVMVDMHLLESANNLKFTQGDSLYQADFASIYPSHGTTKAQYDSSLFYYVTRTDEMDSIYDKVLERLYELESEVTK